MFQMYFERFPINTNLITRKINLIAKALKNLEKKYM